MKPFNAGLSSLPLNIFTMMSDLANKHGAVNLGQGFPDGNGPADVRAKAAEYLEDRPNQYPPMRGVAELRQALVRHDKRFYGLDLDAEREAIVTSGGTEALTSTFLGLVEPGDEVILFAPMFDVYIPMLRRAGAVTKTVRLTPPHWDLPRDELAAAFSAKTKFVLLNTPMNPIGKVFSLEELTFIAELVKKHDCYVLCDEVFEHIVFSGAQHIPLMTLPGMRERCLKMGSAGKTFSLTGWKIGYLTGAPDLITAVATAHQFVTFTSAPNLQRAVAYGLDKDDAYYVKLASDLEAKRDLFAKGLKEIGFTVLPSAGTYFIVADITPLRPSMDDVTFCRTVTEEAGVTCLPLSAFYFYEGDAPRQFVRFAFCKQDAVLEEALVRLRRYFGRR
jgi:aspartate/methionine/tyrosine aminotransferase